MAWANFLPLGAPLLVWALWRIGRRSFRALLADLAEVYLAPLPLFALAGWLGAGQSWQRLAYSLFAAAASLGWFWHRFGGRFLEFFRAAPASEAPLQPIES